MKNNFITIKKYTELVAEVSNKLKELNLYSEEILKTALYNVIMNTDDIESLSKDEMNHLILNTKIDLGNIPIMHNIKNVVKNEVVNDVKNEIGCFEKTKSDFIFYYFIHPEYRKIYIFNTDKLREWVHNYKDEFKLETIKGSQFKMPKFEFCGACAGCGEPSYIKILTQLFKALDETYLLLKAVPASYIVTP